MTLRQYHKKRDFAKTHEPIGRLSHENRRLFVIQKHAASHLHYDFRLELDGVLKSWAVPKGPNLDPHVRRLAMHVEDHPIEYGSFEGIIPKGQYGGGSVMLWDKGTWEPLDKNPRLAYKKGHLRFNLNAEKLHGRWDLIRFKDDQHWFLIKHHDEYIRDQNQYDITEDLNKSVVSHKTIEEIGQSAQCTWDNKKSKLLLPKTGLIKAPFPNFIAPQLATLVDKTPQGNNWLHEVKFDGYRILAFKKGNKVILKSRNNHDWTINFIPIEKAIKDLPVKNILLDGEIVALDKDGKSDFQLLQNSIKNKDAHFIYYIFDMLYIEQYDLRELPLIERKSLLKGILNIDSSTLHYSDHIINNGQQMLEHACQNALEGIVSKRADGIYLSKRSKDWLKIKCLKRQEFVIGGYSAPTGQRSHFGALFLGVFTKDGKLKYAGNVGTGFNQTTLNEVYQQLLENKGTSNPFSTKPPGASRAHWVKPVLVAEIEFTEWTEGGHLRHPSFKGLRLDKSATEVIREKETSLDNLNIDTVQKLKHNKMLLTHPNKILYAKDNITKLDLLHYYEAVSDYMLPYISKRPLTLVRCPSQYNQCFYQRHYNDTTHKALHPIDVQNVDGIEKYIYLDDIEGLLSLVQMSVLEIHPWGSQIDNIEKPDILVFDLDPAPNVPWKTVVSSALEVREHLLQYQLQSFVKTTGGKGLHVVIPIIPQYNWDVIKNFTHVFVQFLEQIKPNEYISKMTKSKRSGKIFIDYLRNQRTATAIGPYSTRARIHAPIATPLSWDELSPHIKDNQYTIKSLLKRLQTLKEDPWKHFWEIRQSLRLDDLT